MRIDPASPELRQTAAELQRAADAAGDPAARGRALNAAAVAATSEARRAHAGAALDSPAFARALGGAFADAMDDARLKGSRSPTEKRR